MATIGSISSGTLRPEDLIPAFVGALDSIARETADARTTDALDKLIAKIEGRMKRASYFDSDRAADDLETLTQELEAHAPPFCYFGSHPGDGADFGFWIAWDSIEDAGRSGELVKVDAGDEWPETARDAEYVLEVTDHGNATLFSALTKEELWSVV